MVYRAVIFDLFGTLVLNFSFPRHEAVLRQMAEVLSVPTDAFIGVWYDTFEERCTGVFQHPEANIDYVGQKLGVPIDERRRRDAARVRFNFTVQSMMHIPEAIAVLSHMKSEGFPTELVSDCSGEVPTIWHDTPFAAFIDVAVFSCTVGLKNPDPRIYQLAADQLGVEPDQCLFISDGGSHELTGAAAAGMHHTLIRYPDENATEIRRVDAETERWEGPVIYSLREVLTLL